MPLVTVEMWAGRTAAQKKELAEGITRAFTQIGTPGEAVQVILREVPRENWAVGGRLASEG